MNSTIFKTIIFLILCLGTNTIFGQWVELNTGAPSSARFDQIECPNSNTCYLPEITGNSLIKTFDGGQTWNEASTGLFLSNFGLVGLSCINENICFVLTGNGTYRTINGGQTWSNVLTPNSGYVQISAVNPNLIYLLGYINNEIYKTTDIGLTWQPVANDLPIGQNIKYTNITFTSASVGHIVGVNSSSSVKQRYIYKTINGGVNWVLKRQDTLLLDNAMFQFPNNQVGYMCEGGFVNHLLKTIDGGETWFNVAIPFGSGNYYIVAMDFLDENKGYLSMSFGNVNLKSTDGGQTWITESVIDFSTDIDVTSLDTVYIATGRNMVLKNSNANLAGNLIDQNQIQFGSLYPNPVNDLLTIELNHPTENMSFILYDITGKEVASFVLDQKITIWDRKELKAGTYLYSIYENNSLLSTSKLELN